MVAEDFSKLDALASLAELSCEDAFVQGLLEAGPRRPHSGTGQRSAQHHAKRLAGPRRRACGPAASPGAAAGGQDRSPRFCANHNEHLASPPIRVGRVPGSVLGRRRTQDRDALGNKHAADVDDDDDDDGGLAPQQVPIIEEHQQPAAHQPAEAGHGGPASPVRGYGAVYEHTAADGVARNHHHTLWPLPAAPPVFVAAPRSGPTPPSAHARATPLGRRLPPPPLRGALPYARLSEPGSAPPPMAAIAFGRQSPSWLPGLTPHAAAIADNAAPALRSDNAASAPPAKRRVVIPSGGHGAGAVEEALPVPAVPGAGLRPARRASTGAGEQAPPYARRRSSDDAITVAAAGFRLARPTRPRPPLIVPPLRSPAAAGGMSMAVGPFATRRSSEEGDADGGPPSTATNSTTSTLTGSSERRRHHHADVCQSAGPAAAREDAAADRMELDPVETAATVQGPPSPAAGYCSVGGRRGRDPQQQQQPQQPQPQQQDASGHGPDGPQEDDGVGLLEKLRIAHTLLLNKEHLGAEQLQQVMEHLSSLCSEAAAKPRLIAHLSRPRSLGGGSSSGGGAEFEVAATPRPVSGGGATAMTDGDGAESPPSSKGATGGRPSRDGQPRNPYRNNGNSSNTTDGARTATVPPAQGHRAAEPYAAHAGATPLALGHRAVSHPGGGGGGGRMLGFLAEQRQYAFAAPAAHSNAREDGSAAAHKGPEDGWGCWAAAAISDSGAAWGGAATAAGPASVPARPVFGAGDAKAWSPRTVQQHQLYEYGRRGIDAAVTQRQQQRRVSSGVVGHDGTGMVLASMLGLKLAANGRGSGAVANAHQQQQHLEAEAEALYVLPHQPQAFVRGQLQRQPSNVASEEALRLPLRLFAPSFSPHGGSGGGEATGLHRPTRRPGDGGGGVAPRGGGRRNPPHTVCADGAHVAASPEVPPPMQGLTGFPDAGGGGPVFGFGFVAGPDAAAAAGRSRHLVQGAGMRSAHHGMDGYVTVQLGLHSPVAMAPKRYGTDATSRRQ